MNLRLTILLVAALLIAVGTFLGLRYTGSEEVQEKNPWLFRIDENSIVYISVSHDGQTIEYAKSLGTEEWNILGEPEIPVYWPKFGGTPLLVSGPRVSRVLADKVDNPASFGLDPPETEVKVTDRSGNSLQFNLGNTTPDIDQQYAILVGDPALFTVPIEWAYVINRLADDPPYLRLFQLEDGALAAFQVISAGRAASYAKKVETGEWYIQGESEVPVQPDKWGDTPAIISGPRVDQVIAETLDNPEQFGLRTAPNCSKDYPQRRPDDGVSYRRSDRKWGVFVRSSGPSARVIRHAQIPGATHYQLGHRTTVSTGCGCRYARVGIALGSSPPTCRYSKTSVSERLKSLQRRGASLSSTY